MSKRRTDENPELLKLKGHGSRDILLYSVRSVCISAYTMLADHADNYRNGFSTMISASLVASFYIYCTEYTHESTVNMNIRVMNVNIRSQSYVALYSVRGTLYYVVTVVDMHACTSQSGCTPYFASPISRLINARFSLFSFFSFLLFSTLPL